MATEKRTELQWLRALAASEVVICHSDLATKHFAEFRLANTWWADQLGGIGVELFFIVSGYVICMKAPEARSGAAFLLSRVRRLFPMYWVFTSLAVITYVLNPAWRLNNFEISLLSFFQSYLILPQQGFPILGVGWTLEHEMMFYGFVALAMTIWHMEGRARFAVGWMLTCLGFIGCFQGPEPGQSLLAYHIFSPFMLAFGFGWLLRCTEEMKLRGRVYSVAVFAAVIAAGYMVGTDFSNRLVIRISLATAIFTGFILCRRAFEADSKLNRAGWMMGDASFSIYLSHWFVLSVIGKLLSVLQPPAATAGLVRGLSIMLSIAIGVWIFAVMERPIDRWLRRGGALADIPWPRLPSISWRDISRRF